MVAIPSVLSGLKKLRTLTGSQDKGLMALERADKFLRTRARDLERDILEGEILYSYSTFNRNSFLTVLTVVAMNGENTDSDSYSSDSVDDAEAEAPADGEGADPELPEAHDELPMAIADFIDGIDADDELPVVDIKDELPVVDIKDIQIDVVQPGPPPATVGVEFQQEEEVDLTPGNYNINFCLDRNLTVKMN